MDAALTLVLGHHGMASTPSSSSSGAIIAIIDSPTHQTCVPLLNALWAAQLNTIRRVV